MICRNCKFNLQGSEKYCPNCGAPLCDEKESTSSQVSPPEAPGIFFTPVKQENEKDTPAIFRSESSSDEEAAPPPPKKKESSASSSKAPVVLMLVLITVVLTVGLFVAAEKFNLAPVLLNYLNNGIRTDTDASELVFSPEETLRPAFHSGTVTPDINYSPTEAYVAKINSLSLRKGPSDAYGLLKSLEAGCQLQITGGTALTDSWIYVYVPAEDCFGWVNAAFISLYTYTESTTEGEMREYVSLNEQNKEA